MRARQRKCFVNAYTWETHAVLACTWARHMQAYKQADTHSSANAHKDKTVIHTNEHKFNTSTKHEASIDTDLAGTNVRLWSLFVISKQSDFIQKSYFWTMSCVSHMHMHTQWIHTCMTQTMTLTFLLFTYRYHTLTHRMQMHTCTQIHVYQSKYCFVAVCGFMYQICQSRSVHKIIWTMNCSDITGCDTKHTHPCCYYYYYFKMNLHM